MNSAPFILGEFGGIITSVTPLLSNTDFNKTLELWNPASSITITMSVKGTPPNACNTFKMDSI